MDLSRQQSFKRFLFGANPHRTLIRLCIISISLILLSSFIRPIRIEGAKLGFGISNSLSKDFQSGDLVSLKLAGESIVALAQIIALPEQTVEIQSGQVLIDGESYAGIYPASFPNDTAYPQTRNQLNEYFVVIYKHNSKAISDFGRINVNKIIGKVLSL